MNLGNHYSVKQFRLKIAGAFLVFLCCLGLMFGDISTVSAGLFSDGLAELSDVGQTVALAIKKAVSSPASIIESIKCFFGFDCPREPAESYVVTDGAADNITKVTTIQEGPKPGQNGEADEPAENNAALAVDPGAMPPVTGIYRNSITLNPEITPNLTPKLDALAGAGHLFEMTFEAPIQPPAENIVTYVNTITNTVIVDEETKNKVNLILRQLDSDRPSYSLGSTYHLPDDLRVKTIDVNSGKFTVDKHGNISTVGDFEITGNFTVTGAQTFSGAAALNAATAIPLFSIEQGGTGAALEADNITLKGSTIATSDSDTSLLINPNGTGAVQFHSASNFIDSTGSLVLDGDVTLTSGGTFYTTDNGNLVFAPNGTGNLVVGETGNTAKIVPFEDSTAGYDLGALTARWFDIYAKGKLDVDSTTLTASQLSFIDTGKITTGASKDLTLQAGTAGKTRVTDGTDYVDIADGTQALYAVKGANAVKLANGTYAVDATGDVRLSGDITVNGGKIIFNGGNESIDNETAHLLKLATSGDAQVVLGDAAGVNQFQIKDSNGNTVASIDSDGKATLANAAITGSLGIGTADPQEALDVNGRVKLAQTFAPADTVDKLYNVSGNLLWNGVNLTAAGGLPVGTEGQTLYNNAGVWTANSGLFYDDTTGNVGIGTTAPSSRLQVVGADTSASTVAQIGGSSGTGLVVLNNGYVGIGTTSPVGLLDITATGANAVRIKQGSSSSSLVGASSGRLAIDAQPTTDSGQTERALSVWMEPGAGAGLSRSFRAIEGDAIIPYGDTGVYSNANSAVGLLFQAQYRGANPGNAIATKGIHIASGKVGGSGNLTNAYGIFSQVGNFMGLVAPTGILSNAYNIYISDASKTGGSITNQYGLYIENQTKGDNNYAIYSAGGQSFFAGNVGIGTPAPSHKLDVVQTGTTTGLAAIKGQNSGINVGTAYGVYGTATGGSATNVGGYFSASGATNNYGLIVENGNVGIGTTGPGAALDVRSGDVYIGGKADGATKHNYLSIFGTKNVSPNLSSDALAIYAGLTGGSSGGGIGAYLASTIADAAATNYGLVGGFEGDVYAGLQVNDGAASTPVNWTGTLVSAIGVNGYAANISTGAGIITTANGGSFSVGNLGASSIIRNARGMYIPGAQATGSDAGQTHNAYGLYIANSITASGGTTNNAWGIYNLSTANNYFAGNVGIGTTGPNTLLHVRGSTPILRIEASGGSQEAQLHLDAHDNTGSAGIYFTRVEQSDVEYGKIGWTGSTTGNMFFEIEGDKKLWINNNGNVGIGTTGPSHKLDVVQTGTTTGLAAIKGLNSGINVGTAYGVYGTATGASVTNVGGYFSATGGVTNNYGLIVESGNVGIGTTGPSSRLHVVGADTSTSTVAQIGGLTGTGLVVLNNGYVGIGTTAPGLALDVVGNIRTTSLAVNGNAVFDGRGTTLDETLSIIGGEGMSAILQLQSDEGDNSSDRYQLKVTASDSFGIQDFSSGAYVDRLTINDGNVGIGTTVPSHKLDVLQTGTTTGLVAIKGLNSGINAGTAYGVYGTATGASVTNVGGYFSATGGVTNNYGLIVANGNVGIGTTGPDTALTVFHNSTETYVPAQVLAQVAVTLRNNTATTNNTSAINFQNSDGLGVAQFGVVYGDRATDYGQLYFATKGSGGFLERMRIDSTGNVGIGTTGPLSKLDVRADASAGYAGYFFNDGNNADRYGLKVQGGLDDGTGTTYYLAAFDGDGGAVGYLQHSGDTFSAVDPSDRRLKANIQNTGISGLDIVSRLRVVDFNRVSNPGGPLIHGFIAQEMQEVYPDAVSVGPDGMLGIGRDILVPVLVKAIQEQQVQIDSLSSLTSQGLINASTTAEIGQEGGGFAELVKNTIISLFEAGIEGIKNFSAENINSNNINTKQVCVKDSSNVDVCLTGDQLRELIGETGVSGGAHQTIEAPLPEAENSTTTLPVAP